MTAGETHQAIEAIFRIERARLIAGLARVVRNVDLAEELAQDALVIALSEWPRTSVPANPGAWLMTAAKRRAIDAIRRDKMRERMHEEIAHATSWGNRYAPGRLPPNPQSAHECYAATHALSACACAPALIPLCDPRVHADRDGRGSGSSLRAALRSSALSASGSTASAAMMA
jgi:DNA-directed RNA polymerase specialized sigma24 family protein